MSEGISGGVRTIISAELDIKYQKATEAIDKVNAAIEKYLTKLDEVRATLKEVTEASSKATLSGKKVEKDEMDAVLKRVKELKAEEARLDKEVAKKRAEGAKLNTALKPITAEMKKEVKDYEKQQEAALKGTKNEIESVKELKAQVKLLQKEVTTLQNQLAKVPKQLERAEIQGARKLQAEQKAQLAAEKKAAAAAPPVLVGAGAGGAGGGDGEKRKNPFENLHKQVTEAKVELERLRTTEGVTALETQNFAKKIERLRASFDSIAKGGKATVAEVNAIQSSIKSLEAPLRSAVKFTDKFGAGIGGQEAAMDFTRGKAYLDSLAQGYKAGSLTLEQWNKELQLNRKELTQDANLTLEFNKSVTAMNAAIQKIETNKLVALEKSIRDITKAREYTGIDVAVTRLRALENQAKEVVGGTEKLGAAIVNLDEKIRTASMTQLNEQLAMAKVTFEGGRSSVEGYNRVLNELRATVAQLGLGDKAFIAIEKAQNSLNKSLAQSGSGVDMFSEKINHLRASELKGTITTDQLVVELVKLRKEEGLTGAQTFKLESAINQAKNKTGQFAHSMTGLSKVFQTAKHHFMWMMSGALIMPFYNLPSQILDTVTKLDASFAKLKSQFQTKPEFAGNIDMINKKMEDMAKWSKLFSTHYGEEIEKVNEVIYQASKVYSKTADIVMASNAGMKLSVMDFAGDASESMTKFIAVTQQFGVAPADMDYFINKIIEAGHLVRANSGEIMDALARNASVLKNAGASIDTSITLMAMSLHKIGVSAETAGTSWKTLIQRMGDPKISKMLKGIGIDMYDAELQSKNFGEVLQVMMDKYASLNDASKNSFLKQVAGIRQGNVLAGALATNLEQWDHLYKTISASPDVLATRVGPALQTNLDTVARRMKSVDAVWQAFVFHIAGSESARVLLAKIFNSIIAGIDYIEKHWDTITKWVKYISLAGGAYLFLSTWVKAVNVMLAVNVGLTTVLTGVKGFLGIGKTAVVAAEGVGTLAGAFTGLSAAAMANITVLAGVAGALAVIVAQRNLLNILGNNKMKADIKGKWSVANENVENIQKEMDLRKQRRDIIKDETISEKERAIQAKALKAQSSFGYSDKGLQILLKQEKGNRGHLRAAYTAAEEITETNPVKMVKNMTKGMLPDPKKWNIAFDSLLADAKKHATKGGAPEPKGNVTLPEKEKKPKKEKGALGVTDKYKTETNDLMSRLKALEQRNNEYAKSLALDIKYADNATKDFYGTMTNDKDVQSMLVTVHDLFSDIGRQTESDLAMIRTYDTAIKDLTAQNAAMDADIAKGPKTPKQIEELKNKKIANENTITSLREKMGNLNLEIEKFPEEFDKMIGASSAMIEKGITDTFELLDQKNEKMKERGTESASAWRKNYLEAINALISKFPILNQAIKEGFMTAPTDYINKLDAQINDLKKTPGEARDSSWYSRIAELTGKLTAVKALGNIVNKVDLTLATAKNESIQKQIALLEKVQAHRKALVQLTGQENVSAAQQIKDAKQMNQLLEVQANVYAIKGDWLNYFNTIDAIAANTQNAKLVYEATLTLEYDKQIKDLEKLYGWKSLMARDDQKDAIDYIKNLQQREILIKKQAALAAELDRVSPGIWTASLETQQGNSLYQSWQGITDEVDTLNQALAAQVPLFKEIQAAQNAAYSSMRDNIKQTLTDLADPNKSFMQSMADAMKRQSDMIQQTILSGFADAISMKLSGPMGKVAEQQGAITSAIFDMFGLTKGSETLKAEQIWNKVYSDTDKAFRVVMKDGADSKGGLSGFVQGAINQALTGSKTGEKITTAGVKTLSLYPPDMAVDKSTEWDKVKAWGATQGIMAVMNMTAKGQAGLQSPLGQMIASFGSSAGGATGGVFGSIFGGLGPVFGPVAGAAVFTAAMMMAENGLGVGRGNSRREAAATMQENRTNRMKDISSRYESLGMGWSDSMIPQYIERSERSKWGLSGTSRWLEDNGVEAALANQEIIIARIEASIETYNKALKNMDANIAEGATRFGIAGESMVQTIGKWITVVDPLAAGGEYQKYSIGSMDSIFGPSGILQQNIWATDASFNSLTSQIDLLNYQLNQMAVAGAETSDAFKEAKASLLDLTQKKYWNDITRGITQSQLLTPFGLSTDQATMGATADAIRKAFGLGANQTIDRAELQLLAQSIVQAEIMAQNGELGGIAAEQVNQQWQLLTDMLNLVDTITTNQLGEAAVGSAASMGEAISGSAQVVQNDITFAVNAGNVFATKTEMQQIAKEMLLMMKQQNWVDASVINI